MIQTVGMISGIIMPFLNIPLIVRIIRRRSSEDISLVWVVGAWICVMGMVPQSLQSPDSVLMAFGIVNGLFFTGVFVSVLFFHPPSGRRCSAAIDRMLRISPIE
jgi:threonine/homoserine efflux transporter RhtA